MTPPLAKLPIGIQTFSEIRERRLVYVDKTAQIQRLVSEGKHYFLSRPRRFGKSLLISAMQSLFECRRELFEGLSVASNWDWDSPSPVIKISFGGVARDTDGMRAMLSVILDSNRKRLGLDCSQPEHGGSCLKELIEGASKKYNRKVVVLVDEYDKFIVDNLDQPEVAKQGREMLKDIYTAIKDSDEFIRFVFITGVSKFSKVSVFSGMNNLKDITLDRRYATICGYTENDLDTVFTEHVKGFDREKMRLWYNGYNFLGESVYNPFDILLFIDSGGLYKNYWFTTGTPTFLFKLIQKHNYYIPQLDSLKVSEGLIDSYDIDNIQLEPILFQAGYLTISEQIQVGAISMFRLRFPNLETRYSFNDHLLGYLTGQGAEKVEHQSRIYQTLVDNDLAGFEQTLKSMFASIPYNNYVNNTISSYEGYYASVIYAYLASLGFDLVAEDVTSKGRIDLAIRLDQRIYLLEFKVEGAGDAISQLENRNYQQKYQSSGKQIILIGIDFDPGTRNISSFKFKTLP